MKKLPMRMCIVTREKCPKSELIRVVKTPNNEVVIDLTQKMNGHGCYLKKDINVIEKAKTTKVLDRVLEITVPLDIYDNLVKQL